MLDIHTIGAGGGSVRHRPGGALFGPKVCKPWSACYGIGDLPTVTDAHVVLGRINPDLFLGGNFLNKSRSIMALSNLAGNLGTILIVRQVSLFANAHDTH
jgi:N-methylhydantoinase A/oxoprolinase/acetone carboxylase beta subunit